MAEKIRVHMLAKQLGVSSKAILEKCRAEGLDVKNHMSTLSAGLEATIREWFSEGAHTTTLETAGRVDLSKVRRKRPARRKKVAEPQAAAAAVAEQAEPSEAPPVGVEATAAEPQPEVEPAGPVEAAGDVEAAAATEAAPPASAEAGAEPTTVEAPPSEPAEPSAPGEPVEEPAAASAQPTVAQPPPTPEPPEVRPAGPQNIPAPAILQGPRVVRIEPPEQVRRPAVTGRAPEAAGPPAQIGPPRPGRRGKAKPLPLNLQPELAEEVGRPKHRAHPRRSARVGEAGERLREWRDRDLIERQERLEAATGRGIRQRRAVETRRAAAPAPAVRKEKVQIAEPITVRAFCSATGIGQNQVIPKLMEHGVLATVTQTIDTELAELIALDFGLELAVVRQRSALDVLQAEFESRQRANLRPRPPVVAFLGHVDHGKTSLLDRIRQTAVAEAEAGGITQHIGAYCVQKGDARVTFIDTPGHEAFTAMRARGANMTDVVVLVVAADDGVMPQTVEAINHARAAKVPIVVALNKIDLPGVDINRVYTQLAEQRLVPQDWGGDIDVIKTSAVTGEGIDELIDHLHALAELLELQADPTVPATGTVIEASMSEGQGVVATLLIQDGSLREGDILVCGRGYGRVRAMRDERGRRLKLAGPSTPVSVSGLDELPQAGDRFYQLDDLKRAKTIAEERRQQLRLESLAEVSKARSLSELLAQQRTAEVPELNVILRADVQGSLDVLSQQLEQLPGDQVRLRILHAGLGAITEGDVILAQASQAVVIGFHVVPEERARQLAEQQGVQIRLYRVIYEVTDDIRQALEGLLAPEKRFESRGKAEVRQLFHISRLGTVAGCMVVDGLIARQYRVRVIRDGRVVRDQAEIQSLRRFKDDVREVRSGLECGIKIAGFDDLKPGDLIESYEIVEHARTL